MSDALSSDQRDTEGDSIKFLYKGKELLESNSLEEAKKNLEKAYELDGENQTTRNLLGLVHFKLGELEQAQELYQQLINENEEEPTLRVNLAMVHIKQERFEDAKEELEHALSLAPDYEKAHSYLGLAYSKLGWYEQARDEFELAGQGNMVRKMEERIAEMHARDGEQAEPVAQAGSEERTLAEVAAEGMAELDQDGFPFISAEKEPKGTTGKASKDDDSWSTFDPSFPSLSAAPMAQIQDEVGPVDPFAKPPQCALIEDFCNAVQLDAGGGGPIRTSSDGLLVVDVENEGHSRVQGLVAVDGDLSFAVECKRFRGRVTDRIFGERDNPILMLRGNGRIFLSPEDGQFTILLLDNNVAYFREEKVFAFGGGLVWENGRLPSEVSSDINLVHFWGSGVVVLRSDKAPRARNVAEGEAVRVSLSSLLGWHGPLIPAVTAVPEFPHREGEDSALVQFTGSGGVLISVS